MRQLLLLTLLLGFGLHARYTKVLQLTVTPPCKPQTATVTLGKKGEKPAVTLTFNSNITVTDTTGEKPQVLLEAPVTWKSNGTHVIHLWMDDDKSQLVVDGTALAYGLPLPQLPSRPAISSSHPAITEKQKPIFQRLAPINFQDDFARTADEASLWKTFAGNFALNMALNPASASGAFQLWGQADKEGLTIASSSKWYWRDFTFATSVLPDDSTDVCGLVFAFENKDTFHRFEVSRAEGMARLIRRSDGKDAILAQRHFRLPATWTRLAVTTADSAVTAYIGGRQVLRFQQDVVCAGAVGLYLKNAPSAYFDDVSVTVSPVSETPFGPCEQRWSDLSGKHFFTDPFMSQWAHPRSFWHAGADNLQWFRSHLFNDVSFTWTKPDSQKKSPVRGCRVRIFADEAHLDRGFLLEVQQGKAVLKLDGAVIAEGAAPSDLTSVSIQAGQDIAVSLNNAPVLGWNAPEGAPILRKGAVAADFGRTWDMHRLYHYDWRDVTSVSSSHRLDYSFEHAPAAWFPQAGTWKATHRWACVPKWSFFAGRGEPGLACVKNGNTILWNLRRIVGDFDLELFAAPMEGTPQRAHFTYPLNINVAFGADGTNLTSGYTFINGMYDFPSRLYCGDRLLGTCSNRVAPGLRLQDIAWYQRVTRVWQHIRIQRRNGRILIDSASHDDNANYIPLKREFDLPDTSDASASSQFAIWTWGENGLAIARATLSFQESPGAAAIPDDFPKPCIAHGNGTNAPRTYRRVTNAISGGQFIAKVWDTPFTLEPQTSMDMLVSFRSPNRPGQPLPDDLHLSLLISANGQAAEAVICGPDNVARDYTFPLHAELTPVPEKRGWHRLTVSLADIPDHFQPGTPVVIDDISIASPYDTLEEIAGLGINPIGASVEYTCPQFHPNAIALKPKPPRTTPLLSLYGRRIFNDFSDGFGGFSRFGGPDGASLLVITDPVDAASHGKVLRLLNQNVGGTAGAIMTDQPFSLDAFPKLAFDYRIPVGIETALIAVADDGAPGKTKALEIAVTQGAISSWPVVGKADIRQDGAWHHVEIDLAALLRPHMKAPFIIRKLLLADSGRMSSHQRIAMYLDNVQFIPAIADGTKIDVANDGTEAVAVRFDNAPGTAPDTAEAIQGATFTAAIQDGGAAWMHVRLKQNGAWQDSTAHLKIETSAQPVNAAIPADAKPAPSATPPAPVISYIPSDRLTRTTFEPAADEAGTAACFGGFETRREAWVIHNREDAATGSYCGELVNLDDRGFYSAFFRKAPWDIRRYPCVSFNYRFKQNGCALHLSMLVNDAMTIIEWTGKNARRNHFDGSVIGSVDGGYALQDDQWHEASFNLLELLKKERYAHGFPPSGLIASELATWATVHTKYGGGYRNPENARILIDNFTIFSNEGRDPAFEWSSHPNDAAYAIAFDQTPDTIPDENAVQTATHVNFSGIAPGTWFFHLRVKDKSGAWRQPAHKQIVIE